MKNNRIVQSIINKLFKVEENNTFMYTPKNDSSDNHRNLYAHGSLILPQASFDSLDPLEKKKNNAFMEDPFEVVLSKGVESVLAAAESVFEEDHPLLEQYSKAKKRECQLYKEIMMDKPIQLNSNLDVVRDNQNKILFDHDNYREAYSALVKSIKEIGQALLMKKSE